MRTLSISFLILAAVVCGAAQSNSALTGRIVSRNQTDLGLVAVKVELVQVDPPFTRFESVTDPQGNFAFLKVLPGEYKLNILNGRQDQTISTQNVSIRSGNTNLTVVVNPDEFGIREIVNVAADADQPLEQVSKSVDVLPAQQLRDRADISLIDSLRIIPGFRVQQLGGFGRTASVKSRGLRNQDTAVLIDGIRFRDAASITGDASAFLSDITLTSVRRVEVLRGPGSSLYGTNATGGAVDLQTPVPAAGPTGQISFAAGGLGLRRVRGNFSDASRNGKFGFTLAGARTLYTSGIDGNDDAHNTNFQARVEAAPLDRVRISGRVFVSDAYVRLNASPDTFGDPPVTNDRAIDARQFENFVFDLDDPDAEQRSKFFNGQLLASFAMNDRVSFTATYSGLKTSRKNDNGVLGRGFQSPSTSIFDGIIQTANARLNVGLSPISLLTAGYEYEHEKFGNDGRTPSGAGNFFTRARQASHTVFAQALSRLYNAKLSIAGDVRAQFFSLDNPKFSLSNAPYSGVSLDAPASALTVDGSAAYQFGFGTKIRMHGGTGYRVPSLYERFGTFFSTFGGPSFIALGDPGLKPERSYAVDAGIDQQLFSDKALLTATYFYNRLDRTIGFGSPAPAIGTTLRPFGGYINTEGGISRGVELSATARPSTATDVFVSYTFTNSDQFTPQVPGSGIASTLGIPLHQFTAAATQRIGQFWVSGDLLVTSSYLAPLFSGTSFQSYVYRFGGNRRFDLTAGYTFQFNRDRQNLRLFGTIENVLGYEYFENGFRTPQRNGRIGVAYSF